MPKLGTRTETESKTVIKVITDTRVLVAILTTLFGGGLGLGVSKISAKSEEPAIHAEIRIPLATAVTSLNAKVDTLERTVEGIKYDLRSHTFQDSLLRHDIRKLTETLNRRQ